MNLKKFFCLFKRANLQNVQSNFKNSFVYNNQFHEEQYKLYNITLRHTGAKQ